MARRNLFSMITKGFNWVFGNVFSIVATGVAWLVLGTFKNLPTHNKTLIEKAFLSIMKRQIHMAVRDEKLSAAKFLFVWMEGALNRFYTFVHRETFLNEWAKLQHHIEEKEKEMRGRDKAEAVSEFTRIIAEIGHLHTIKKLSALPSTNHHTSEMQFNYNYRQHMQNAKALFDLCQAPVSVYSPAESWLSDAKNAYRYYLEAHRTAWRAPQEVGKISWLTRSYYATLGGANVLALIPGLKETYYDELRKLVEISERIIEENKVIGQCYRIKAVYLQLSSGLNKKDYSALERYRAQLVVDIEHMDISELPITLINLVCRALHHSNYVFSKDQKLLADRGLGLVIRLSRKLSRSAEERPLSRTLFRLRALEFFDNGDKDKKYFKHAAEDFSVAIFLCRASEQINRESHSFELLNLYWQRSLCYRKVNDKRANADLLEVWKILNQKMQSAKGGLEAESKEQMKFELDIRNCSKTFSQKTLESLTLDGFISLIEVCKQDHPDCKADHSDIKETVIERKECKTECKTNNRSEWQTVPTAPALFEKKEEKRSNPEELKKEENGLKEKIEDEVKENTKKSKTHLYKPKERKPQTIQRTNLHPPRHSNAKATPKKADDSLIASSALTFDKKEAAKTKIIKPAKKISKHSNNIEPTVVPSSILENQPTRKEQEAERKKLTVEKIVEDFHKREADKKDLLLETRRLALIEEEKKKAEREQQKQYAEVKSVLFSIVRKVSIEEEARLQKIAEEQDRIKEQERFKKEREERREKKREEKRSVKEFKEIASVTEVKEIGINEESLFAKGIQPPPCQAYVYHINQVANDKTTLIPGGLPRDCLTETLQYEDVDIDIVTTASLAQIQKALPPDRFVYNIHADKLGQPWLVIVTPTPEEAKKGEFTLPAQIVIRDRLDDLEEEACLRDFTINSTFWYGNKIYAPLIQTKEDFRDKIIRVVPQERKDGDTRTDSVISFTKDPLRILRAVELFYKLKDFNFYYDPENRVCEMRKAIRQCAPLLATLPVNQVNTALRKIFKNGDRDDVFSVLVNIAHHLPQGIAPDLKGQLDHYKSVLPYYKEAPPMAVQHYIWYHNNRHDVPQSQDFGAFPYKKVRPHYPRCEKASAPYIWYHNNPHDLPQPHNFGVSPVVATTTSPTVYSKRGALA